MRPSDVARTQDDTADIYSPGAVATCPMCSGLMPVGYPLWGAHLHAAVALHAAHRAVSGLAAIPELTDRDRVLGRSVKIVERDA